MRVEDFNYELPEELIAQDPVEPRDSSRLLLLDRTAKTIRHKRFSQLPEELVAGDTLVINDTKVIPARIYAHKESGATIELLLLKQVGLDCWQALVRPGKKAVPGVKLFFELSEISAEIIDTAEEGSRIIKFNYDGDFYSLLDRLGQMPLPPYIKKKLEDQSRYQPVYARERGSAAAPTAGLHFTESLLEELEAKDINIVKILLHVGLGTFRPVKTQIVEEHIMHAEYFRIEDSAAAILNKAKADRRRIIGVGTTSVRALESAVGEDGLFNAKDGLTEKFIYPGYQFKTIDGIITNFHLPKSTLLMLVSAFADRDYILNAYKVAIEERYRFFSFGDAMLII